MSSFTSDFPLKATKDPFTQKNNIISTEHFLTLICENELLKSHLDQSKLQTKRWRKQFRNVWKAFKIIERCSSGKLEGLAKEFIYIIQNSKVLEKQLKDEIEAYTRKDKEIVAIHRGMNVLIKQKENLEEEFRNFEEEYQKLRKENEELKANFASIDEIKSLEKEMNNLKIHLDLEKESVKKAEEAVRIRDKQLAELAQFIKELENNKTASMLEKEKAEKDKLASEELLGNAKEVIDRLQKHYHSKEAEANAIINHLTQGLQVAQQTIADLEAKKAPLNSFSSSLKTKKNGKLPIASKSSNIIQKGSKSSSIHSIRRPP